MQSLHNIVIGNITWLLWPGNPLFSVDLPLVVDYNDRKNSRCIKHNVKSHDVWLCQDP